MPPSGFLLNWQATEGYVNRQQTVAAQFGPLLHHNLIVRLPSDKVTDQILTRMLQAGPPTAPESKAGPPRSKVYLPDFWGEVELVHMQKRVTTLIAATVNILQNG